MEARAAQLPPDDKVVTTIVTYEEQTRGWRAYAAKSQDLPQQVKAYERLKRPLRNYQQWELLDFDMPAANEFARLRRSIRVGTLDLKIAAIALSRVAVVVSRNLKDFGKVPNLRVEDWTKG
jgi:tRNA(fMet)-specific endonuclease VapC